MSKPWIHSLSSAKTFGGVPEDYLDIHTFLDSSKSAISTNVHRALTHNSWFISMVIPRVFGETFKRESDGKVISSRDIAEQHVAEDFKGFIPSAADYLNEINMQDWMMNGKGSPPSFANVVHKSRKKKEEEKVKKFFETVKAPPTEPPIFPSPPKLPYENPHWNPPPGILID